MRVGKVVSVIPEKSFGFIRSEDLHEDVFFHFTKVERVGRLDLQLGDEVEFEIDELAKIEKQRLQATFVRRSIRPLEMRLKSSDAPELNAKHHPKARRKKPGWRQRGGSETESESNSDES